MEKSGCIYGGEGGLIRRGGKSHEGDASVKFGRVAT